MEKSAYSIAEMCDRLGLSRPTIERLVASGTLRSIKVGARRLITAGAEAEFLERGVDRVA